MEVCMDKRYIFRFFGVWRNDGEIYAEDLGKRECAGEMAGNGASAAAHVEDTGRVFDGRMEDFAHHDFLNEFMLAVESLMFGCADVCQSLCLDRRSGGNRPGRNLVRVLRSFLCIIV